jgi:hypothetical protein
MSDEIIIDEKSKKVDDKKKTKKDILYEKEQEETLKKLFTILEINPDEGKSVINATAIDEKKDNIIELIGNIHRYYSSVMLQEVKKTKLYPHMSIIRHILKHHNYCLIRKGFVEKKEDIVKYYKYIIVKNH